MESSQNLPRFGVRMFLDKKLADIRYFGMGPQESYRDKHQAASHGLYRANVGDLHEDYIRPQENGSHYDCEYVELKQQPIWNCGIRRKGIFIQCFLLYTGRT